MTCHLFAIAKSLFVVYSAFGKKTIRLQLLSCIKVVRWSVLTILRQSALIRWTWCFSWTTPRVYARSSGRGCGGFSSKWRIGSPWVRPTLASASSDTLRQQWSFTGSRHHRLGSLFVTLSAEWSISAAAQTSPPPWGWPTNKSSSPLRVPAPLG